MKNTKWFISKADIKTYALTSLLVLSVLAVLGSVNHVSAVEACVSKGYSVEYCEKHLNKVSN